jgi:hypothetical protein
VPEAWNRVAKPGAASVTIVLVACSARKRGTPCPAKDLYTSTLFRYSRRYAEQFGDRWYILSARHGLLSPEARISPYEQTLPGLTGFAPR